MIRNVLSNHNVVTASFDATFHLNTSVCRLMIILSISYDYVNQTTAKRFRRRSQAASSVSAASTHALPVERIRIIMYLSNTDMDETA